MSEVNFLVKKGLTVPKGSASTPAIIFDASDSNTGLYSPGANQVAVATNGTGRLFVDASGNINIGGSDIGVLGSAGKRLAVGTTSAGTSGAVTIFSSTSGLGYLAFGDGTAGSDSYRGLLEYDHTSDSLRTYTAGSQRMIVTSAGLVGIGTSDPGSYSSSANNLVIANSGDSGLTIRSGTANSGSIYFADGTTGTSLYQGIIYYNHVNDSLNFHTNYAGSSNARMVIDSSGRVGIGITSPSEALDVAGNVTISGSISKGSGSFKIKHPLKDKKETHYLVHSFIEGPQADLIYRGQATLKNGKTIVNLDKAGRMTEGTFEALCTNISCFVSNESDWTAIRAKVNGNLLTIEAQDTTSNAKVNWMVVGERKDEHMLETSWTDENGRIITEPAVDQK